MVHFMKKNRALHDFGPYEDLLRSLDTRCQELRVHYGAEIVCSGGCSPCCDPGITLFPVEALYIKNISTGKSARKETIMIHAVS